MDRFWEWFTAALCLAGFWLCLVMLYEMTPTSTKDFWEIAGAIGTLGAVIAALGISHKDRRRQRQESMDKAVLEAARILLPLANTRAELRHIRSWFQSVITVDPDPEEAKAVFARVRAIGSQIDPGTSLALIPLENGCAIKLAAVRGHIEAAQQGLDAARYPFLENPAKRERRVEMAKRFLFNIEESVILLDQVIGECDRVARHILDPEQRKR